MEHITIQTQFIMYNHKWVHHSSAVYVANEKSYFKAYALYISLTAQQPTILSVTT